jgi:hypothetical protein
MNNQQSNQGKSSQSGCSFPQRLVSQEPVFDRKLKVHRPSKRRKKGDPRYL